MLAGAGVVFSSTPSTFFSFTTVAGDVPHSPASETQRLVISNPAEFTFRKAVKETKGKSAKGQGPSYNNAVDGHTVLTKTAGSEHQVAQGRGRDQHRQSIELSDTVAGVFSRPFRRIMHIEGERQKLTLCDALHDVLAAPCDMHEPRRHRCHLHHVEAGMFC